MTSAKDPDRTIAHAALGAFDLPEGTTVKPIRLSNNSVYEVLPAPERSGRLVLRVHRPGYRSGAQTTAELSLLEQTADPLAEVGVRVPRPMRTGGGGLVAQVDASFLGGGSSRHCDLLTWVDGQVVRPTMGLGPEGSRALGRALACLHDASAVTDVAALESLPRWDTATLLTEASPFRPGPLPDVLDPRELELFADIASRTDAVFCELDQVPGSWGVIHCDFILLNCHLRRRAHGWDVGLIDFDDCGWGYLLYDLAAIIGNLADFPNYPAMRDAFLEGYRRVRSLPASAEGHLPVLMAARHAMSALCAAGRADTKANAPAAEHIAYRMDQIRACLDL